METLFKNFRTERELPFSYFTIYQIGHLWRIKMNWQNGILESFKVSKITSSKLTNTGNEVQCSRANPDMR